MAWGDDTWWLHAVWRDWFDATLMSYRNNPAQRLVNQTGRYWDVGGPTANARKAPLGQQLRVQDAAGWCANGFFILTTGTSGTAYPRAVVAVAAVGVGRVAGGPARRTKAPIRDAVRQRPTLQRTLR